MRICLVYDCLFPHTVGGGERWYRNVAERLAADGHEVTYLTLRQWPKREEAGLPGVDVRVVGPQMDLYVDGRRRLLPPLVFGLGVFVHLLLRGRRYDVVETASFPYFSLLAAAVLRPLGRYRLAVDWFEVWTRDYWRDYLGPAKGTIGWLVQRACIKVPQVAFSFSRRHAERLRAGGLRGPVTVLEGMYGGAPASPAAAADGERPVVFAGRHIPEKRVPALVEAMAVVRNRAPELRCDIYGDGPDRSRVEQAIEREGLAGTVTLHGFVSTDDVERALGSALCMVLPSRREGYGLVVVESAARGTPSVVVDDPDNAAVELIEDGVNGVVARSASPEDLAEAIVRVAAAGSNLRDSTARWFAANARRLSLGASLDAVAAGYRGPASTRR